VVDEYHELKMNGTNAKTKVNKSQITRAMNKKVPLFVGELTSALPVRRRITTETTKQIACMFITDPKKVLEALKASQN